MVTPTTLGLSQTLERELGSRKWDLKDTAKRDQWLLATKNALMEDPDAFVFRVRSSVSQTPSVWL